MQPVSGVSPIGSRTEEFLKFLSRGEELCLISMEWLTLLAVSMRLIFRLWSVRRKALCG